MLTNRKSKPVSRPMLNVRPKAHQVLPAGETVLVACLVDRHSGPSDLLVYSEEVKAGVVNNNDMVANSDEFSLYLSNLTSQNIVLEPSTIVAHAQCTKLPDKFSLSYSDDNEVIQNFRDRRQH